MSSEYLQDGSLQVTLTVAQYNAIRVMFFLIIVNPLIRWALQAVSEAITTRNAITGRRNVFRKGGFILNFLRSIFEEIPIEYSEPGKVHENPWDGRKGRFRISIRIWLFALLAIFSGKVLETLIEATTDAKTIYDTYSMDIVKVFAQDLVDGKVRNGRFFSESIDLFVTMDRCVYNDINGEEWIRTPRYKNFSDRNQGIQCDDIGRKMNNEPVFCSMGIAKDGDICLPVQSSILRHMLDRVELRDYEANYEANYNLRRSVLEVELTKKIKLKKYTGRFHEENSGLDQNRGWFEAKILKFEKNGDNGNIEIRNANKISARLYPDNYIYDKDRDTRGDAETKYTLLIEEEKSEDGVKTVSWITDITLNRPEFYKEGEILNVTTGSYWLSESVSLKDTGVGRDEFLLLKSLYYAGVAQERPDAVIQPPFRKFTEIHKAMNIIPTLGAIPGWDNRFDRRTRVKMTRSEPKVRPFTKVYSIALLCLSLISILFVGIIAKLYVNQQITVVKTDRWSLLERLADSEGGYGQCIKPATQKEITMTVYQQKNGNWHYGVASHLQLQYEDVSKLNAATGREHVKLKSMVSKKDACRGKLKSTTNSPIVILMNANDQSLDNDQIEEMVMDLLGESRQISK